jgi:hypothetical protein
VKTVKRRKRPFLQLNIDCRTIAELRDLAQAMGWPLRAFLYSAVQDAREAAKESLKSAEIIRHCVQTRSLRRNFVFPRGFGPYDLREKN